MKWFNNPETLEDLKKQYKRLAFQNHPDRGGKTSDMQEINAEYEDLFSRLKDVHKNAQGEFYTARTATTETATEFMDIIEKLIRCRYQRPRKFCRTFWMMRVFVLYQRRMLSTLLIQIAKSWTARKWIGELRSILESRPLKTT